MALQIGFPEVLIEAFSDADFNLDPINKITINPFSFDSADEQTANIAKSLATVIRGDGTKEKYEEPNPESGTLNFSFLNPLLDRFVGFIFPDSIQTIDGAKVKREYFDTPGRGASEWFNTFKVTVKPIDPTTQLAVAPNDWLVYPRVSFDPAQTDSFSSTPGKTEVVGQSLGGNNPGKQGSLLGDIDISTTVDLSTGAPQKIDLDIGGTLYTNIDVTGAVPASTTGTEIIDAINTAVGLVVATIQAGTGFLVLTAIDFNQSITVDDPSDVSTSAVTTVFQSGGVAPIVSTNQAGAVKIPILIRGDETAV